MPFPFAEAGAGGGRRLSDPPSFEVYKPFPSARRGHTVVDIGGFLYLFGGYGSGHTCDNTLSGDHRLGLNAYNQHLSEAPGTANTDNPTTNECRHGSGASNELWRLDPTTYTWALLRTIPNGLLPPPRERHSAAVVNTPGQVSYAG